MTQTQITMLPTRDLIAIVRSTNPNGRFWLELVWAKDEIARRNIARRNRAALSKATGGK
jgi:hypothetical protein